MSNHDGRRYCEIIAEPEAWLRQSKSPRFLQQSWQQLRGEQAYILDFGGNNRQSGGVPAILTGSGQHWRSLMRVLAALSVSGSKVDWRQFHQQRPFRKLALPTYPFQRKSYWSQDYSAITAGNDSDDSAAPVAAPVPDATITPQEPAPKVVFYKKVWQLSAGRQSMDWPQRGLWLVLTDHSPAAEALVAALSGQGQRLVIVECGADYRSLGADRYVIAAATEAHYHQLWSEIQSTRGPVYAILHLWSCADRDDVSGNLGLVAEKLGWGVEALFFLAKAMQAAAPAPLAKIFTVTMDAVHIAGSKSFACIEKAPLAAFLRSLQLELGVGCRSIDFDSAEITPEQIAHCCLDEFVNDDAASEVIYRDTKRFVATLQPLSLLPGSPRLKKRGVYLISGGSSGIGAQVAAAIAAQVQPVLIITGRTPLPPPSEWANWPANQARSDAKSQRIHTLQHLQRLGASVRYFGVDVTDAEAMATVVAAVEKEFGAIAGVIHSGGIKEDSLIANKSIDSLRRVLAPKVRGTMVLDQVTAAHPLDFFVVFSSLAAVLGNAGQGDYAVANAFMDAFIARRSQLRPGRSLTINWPYWREGGMSLPAAALKRMQAGGFLPLETTAGIAAFLACLDEAAENAIVVINEKVMPTPALAPTPKTEAQQHLEKALIAGLQQLLLLEDHEIDADMVIDDLGLDAELRKRVIAAVAARTGVSIDVAQFDPGLSIAALAARISQHQSPAELDRAAAPTPPVTVSEAPTPVATVPESPAPKSMAKEDAAVEERRARKIEKYLVARVKQLLLLSDDEIELENTFEEFGIDSLVMKEMVKSLEDYLGRPVEPTTFFEYPTIPALAVHLSRGGAIAAEPEPTRRPASGPELDAAGSALDQDNILPVAAAGPAPEQLVPAHSSAVDPEPEPEPPLSTSTVVASPTPEQLVPARSSAAGPASEIAVIGFACRFPDAENGEQFWRNLQAGRCSIREIPKSRMDIDRLYSPDAMDPDKTYCRWGGFVDGVDQFAAEFFGIPEAEAAVIDPQQRHALEVAWEVFEHAGYSARSLWGKNVGVFFGARSDSYEGGRRDNAVIRSYLTGRLTNFISARISNFFNLKGASLTLDTACSSSLVSIHYACRSLRQGECDLAIAGGAEFKVIPFPFVCLSTAQALSREGNSYVFDKNADGFVPGEGVAAVLLKPLAQARADGDHIYAVVKGSATNNDGYTMGITTPNLEAQSQVIARALLDAGVNPETISYVEAHGTGTLIGDPIEVKGLTNVFRRYSQHKNYCAVGSVKTNIGHLDTAAGVAGFLKVVLALYHRQIPPTLNCQQPNPRFRFIDSPFYPNTRLSPWSPLAGIRRAGISSFGFGGTNCHIVLEESPPPLPRKANAAAVPDDILTLSAQTPTALTRKLAAYQRYLEQHPDIPVADFCFSANAGREHFRERYAGVGQEIADFHRQLAQAGERPVDAHPQGRVLLMFPGQGALYPGMGQELYQQVPVFRQALDRCQEILSAYLPQPLSHYVFSAGSAELKETAITQPVTFAVSYSLAQIWQHWGLRPAALMGHSVGEYVAACLAEVFSLEDALKIVCSRGRLMQRHCPRGAMAVLFCDQRQAQALLAQLSESEQGQIAIAAVNAPTNVVISGADAVVAAVSTSARQQGVRSHQLAVSHAFHSPLMQPMLGEFAQILDSVSFSENRIPVISNVSGEWLEEELLGKDYWLRHVRQAVLFGAGIATARQRQIDIFVETGPGTGLSSITRKIIGNAALLCSTLAKDKGQWPALLKTMARLYTRQVDFDFARVYAGQERRRIALPTYPFERKSYWHQQDNEQWYQQNQQATPMGSGTSPTAIAAGATVPPGFDSCPEFSLRQVVYTREFSLENEPVLAQHAILGMPTWPAVGYWEMAVNAGRQALNTMALRLDEVVHKLLLQVAPGQKIATRLCLTPEKHLQFTIASQVPGGDEWVENCSGKLDILVAAPPPDCDLAALRSRLAATPPLPGEEIYQRFAELGMEYAPQFQCIRQIWSDEHQALAHLQLAPSMPDSGYSYHPALMDAALQAIIAILLRQGTGGTLVPFFIEQVAFWRPLPSQIYSHITLRRISAEIIHSDVEILDSAGQVVVAITGFHLKRVRDTAAPAPSVAAVPPPLQFYQPCWHERPALDSPQPTESQRPLLVLLRDEDEPQRLTAALGRHLPLIRVYPGDQFRRDSATSYHIDYRRETDYQLLWQELQPRGISEIVHLWNYSASPHQPDSLEQLEQALFYGVYSVFFLVRQLGDREVSLRIVSSFGQSVAADAEIVASRAMLSGLAQVIQREYRHLRCCHIDLEPCVPETEAQLLEGIRGGDDPVVAYRNRRRLVKGLQRLEIPGPHPPITFREHGVYLISGGMGGIGLEIGKYLAQNYQARLALLNRTALPPRSEWAERRRHRDASAKKIETIIAMEDAGAVVLPLAGDVADWTRMRQCLAEIQERFGTIHGVIHAAGFLDDGLLGQISPEKFAGVLRPKVHGTWVLSQIMAELPLDFFLLFSGAVTQFANVGQGNYVVANLFQDAYAHYLQQRRQRALTINWWFWGETGMVATSDYLDNFRRQGFTPMSTAQALTAFNQALASGQRQVVIAAFPEQVLAPAPTPAPTPPAAVAATPQAPLSAKKRGRAAAATMQKYLAEKINQLTGQLIPGNQFDQAFLDLGIDSLVLINLAGQLERDADINLYPTVFFEYNTVTKLAAYLAAEYQQQLLPIIAPQAPASVEVAPPVASSTPVTASPPTKAPANFIHIDADAVVRQLTPAKEPQPPTSIASPQPSMPVAATESLRLPPPAPGKMAAILIDKPGTFANLISDSVAIPEPGASEVSIRVRAAGINFSDVMTVLGTYPNAGSRFPYIMGNEVAGTIVKVGSMVKRFRPGQEVIALTNGFGGYAEMVVVSEAALVLKPAHLSFAEAASFPIIFLTAYHALHYLGRISQGERILILGAAGGVGLMAVQLARLAKAEIIAAAGSAPKIDYLRTQGVAHAIDYRAVDIIAAVRELTAGRGVDLILTSSTGSSIAGLLSLLAPNARFLEMGMAGLRLAPPLDFSKFVDNQSFFSIDLKRLPPQLVKQHLAQMQTWLQRRQLRPIACRAFPVEQVRQAFAHIANRDNIGKVVLEFPQPQMLAPQRRSQDIAIVGMSCRYPAGADLDQFWHSLAQGVDAITAFPDERLALIGSKTPVPVKGGFIEEIDRFDCFFFNISPAEASVMDPQQRLFLEVCWEAVESAGYGGKGMLPKATGVFVGVSRLDYQALVAGCPRQLAGHAIIGNTHSTLASRLSYFLDLRGPTIAVNTACSSSLVALHQACDSIIHGECQMAIAGGVNLCITPDSAIAFQSMKALSPDGRCKAFDSNADGFVSSEGAGALLLKSLDQAVADGDHIQAIIKATALNNDGFSNGITAPNPAAQTEVINLALAKAGIDASSISYIEAHGTGTLLGDPVEIQALRDCFQHLGSNSVCAIGSVKSNIGHSETAAGVAGVIKTVLALNAGQLPPSLHFHRVNPAIPFINTPFYVNDRLSHWQSPSSPRRAGVSSFGFSGTNAHVILEQAPPQSDSDSSSDHQPQLFTLAAKNENGLRHFAARIAKALTAPAGPCLRDICYSANLGKRPLEYRLATVASSRQQLQQRLDELAQGNCCEQVHLSRKADTDSGMVLIFMDNDHQPPLAHLTFESEPVYADAAGACRQFAGANASKLATFIHEYAVARLLLSWGITPSAVVGVGIGREVALVIAGSLSLEQALSHCQKPATPLTIATPQIPVISTASWEIIASVADCRAELEQNAANPLAIAKIAAQLASLQLGQCLEIGGHRLGGHDLGADEPAARQALLDTLGQWYVQGGEIRWQDFYQRRGNKVPLPTYPFERKSYWLVAGKPLLQKSTTGADQRVPVAAADVTSSKTTVAPPRQLSITTSGDGTGQLATIRRIIATILLIDPEDLDIDISFGDYGMDSMLIKEAVNALEAHYGCSLSASIFHDHSTVAALADYFTDLSGSKAPATAGDIPELRQTTSAQAREITASEAGDVLLDTLDQMLRGELSVDAAGKRLLARDDGQ